MQELYLCEIPDVLAVGTKHESIICQADESVFLQDFSLECNEPKLERKRGGGGKIIIIQKNTIYQSTISFYISLQFLNEC